MGRTSLVSLRDLVCEARSEVSSTSLISCSPFVSPLLDRTEARSGPSCTPP